MGSQRKAILTLSVMACGLMSSCKTSEMTWSEDLRSLYGKHVARGRSDIYGGFGTDAVQTTVDLNWTTGSQSPVNILVLPDAPENVGAGSVLEMRSLTPTQLLLTYKGSETPLFEAVKCYGVDIVLRAAPNSSPGSRR